MHKYIWLLIVIRHYINSDVPKKTGEGVNDNSVGATVQASVTETGETVRRTSFAGFWLYHWQLYATVAKNSHLPEKTLATEKSKSLLEGMPETLKPAGRTFYELMRPKLSVLPSE